MSLTLSEYLDSKGALELLCEINPHGSRYGDLKRELPISNQTLSNRLNEGEEVSLLRREILTGERGTSHTYVLTPKGATFRRYLEESATVIAFRQFKQTRNQFEEKKRETREWALAELPGFSDEAHERHLELIQDFTMNRNPSGPLEHEDTQEEN